MAQYTDLMQMKNDTERKGIVKERVTRCIYNALCTEFGEEFVRYLDNDIYVGENGVKIPRNHVIADVGEVVNKEKFNTGVLVDVNATVKNWNDVHKRDNTITYALTMDDIDEGIEIAKSLAVEKEEKAKQAELEKQAKIAKDKARREKK